LHLDVDVLDPSVMPAVDAPDPGGIAYPELELLLRGLVGSPDCLGAEITVFDPDFDIEGTYAADLVNALVTGFSAPAPSSGSSSSARSTSPSARSSSTPVASAIPTQSKRTARPRRQTPTKS
jgi:arginase